MGLETSPIKSKSPSGRIEAARGLRVREHRGQARAYTIFALLNLPAIKSDRPAGNELLNYVVSHPSSAMAKALKTEIGWKDLKFVFPDTLDADGFVNYVRWDTDYRKFKAYVGATAIHWRSDFRTVHKL